jgi:hypothetical protein
VGELPARRRRREGSHVARANGQQLRGSRGLVRCGACRRPRSAEPGRHSVSGAALRDRPSCSGPRATPLHESAPPAPDTEARPSARRPLGPARHVHMPVQSAATASQDDDSSFSVENVERIACSASSSLDYRFHRRDRRIPGETKEDSKDALASSAGRVRGALRVQVLEERPPTRPGRRRDGSRQGSTARRAFEVAGRLRDQHLSGLVGAARVLVEGAASTKRSRAGRSATRIVHESGATSPATCDTSIGAPSRTRSRVGPSTTVRKPGRAG